MQLTTTELIVPAGTSDRPDIVIDIQTILAAEVRQQEVQSLTPTKAPELLATFNHSWREIHALTVRLEAEKNKATKTADHRKGVLLLEVIPARLKELNISSAADTRQAVIDTDTEYERLTDRVDQLEAAVALFKGKLKSFENAYTSVKKIMGEDAFNMAGRGTNSALSGDTRSSSSPSVKPPSTPPPPPTIPPSLGNRSDGAPRPVRPGFGQSRY
jgi:hypothetical protein